MATEATKRGQDDGNAGSYPYPISRGGRTRLPSRAAYLKDKVRGTNDRSLCQAMELAVRSRVEQEDGGGDGTEESKSTFPEAWKGFPWLTLVLGSGCLDLWEEPGFTSTSLAQAVHDALEDLPWPEESESPATIAQRFTESLVWNRMSIPGQKTQPEPQGNASGLAAGHSETPTIDPIDAYVTLIAALMTRLFHRVLAAGPSALARWDDDAAYFDLTLSSYNLRDVRTSLLDPLVELIDRSKSLLSSGGWSGSEPRQGDSKVAAATMALLDDIGHSLVPGDNRTARSIGIVHLRLMTEVAWFFLTRRTPIYPGWTDLLFQLRLRKGEEIITGSQTLSPLTKLWSSVSDMLMYATRESWKSLDPEIPSDSPRDRLYEGAAEVMWAQTDALIGLGPSTVLPPAVAFVTSFDVELEMALWSAPRKGMFSVVVPVHILKVPEASAKEAEFGWLIGDVDSSSVTDWSEGLEMILHPTNWRPFTPDYNPRQLLDRPIVVHLNGCPLFELGSLPPGLLSEFKLSTKGSHLSVVHAVTVDEYFALRLSELEMFWTGNDASKDPPQRVSRALHPNLLEDGEWNPRFWLSLGVPVADPAVRSRVMSQIAVSRMRSGSPDDASSPARTPTYLPPKPTDGNRRRRAQRSPGQSDIEGLAVNKNIDEDEAGLLYWLGFDVVSSDCSDFVDDLAHYARHVRADPYDEWSGKRPPTDRSCPLAEETSR
jgi:hypothetical protein